jgi:uncharacterized protein YyaL (SSP411 family)
MSVKRVKPRLDDEILTAWNGLMAKGYVDAYRAFDEPVFLNKATKNATFFKYGNYHRSLMK